MMYEQALEAQMEDAAYVLLEAGTTGLSDNTVLRALERLRVRLEL